MPIAERSGDRAEGLAPAQLLVRSLPIEAAKTDKASRCLRLLEQASARPRQTILDATTPRTPDRSNDAAHGFRTKRWSRTGRRSARCRWRGAGSAGGCCRSSTSAAPRSPLVAISAGRPGQRVPGAAGRPAAPRPRLRPARRLRRPPARGAIGAEGGAGWPVIRLLVGALFAWSASLLTADRRRSNSWRSGRAFVVLDFGVRAIVAPYLQGLEPDRALGPGRRRPTSPSGCAPMRRCTSFATVVASVAPLEPDDSGRARPGRSSWSSATTPTAS